MTTASQSNTAGIEVAAAHVERQRQTNERKNDRGTGSPGKLVPAEGRNDHRRDQRKQIKNQHGESERKRVERAEQRPGIECGDEAEQNSDKRVALWKHQRKAAETEPYDERNRRHEKPRRRHRQRIAAALRGQARRGVGHRIARSRRQRHDDAEPRARMRRHIDCSHCPSPIFLSSR
jgi:hypothetical protein